MNVIEKTYTYTTGAEYIARFNQLVADWGEVYHVQMGREGADRYYAVMTPWDSMSGTERSLFNEVGHAK